jgi:transcription elongation factor SPT6
MMTAEDDIIRAIDIPERMQIAQSGLEARALLTPNGPEDAATDILLRFEELAAAASWCATRISDDLTKDFIQAADGSIPPLREPFISAIQRVLHFLCVDYFEVPFIWVHRRDYFIYYNPDSEDPASRSRALLSREDLWKLYHLAIKYRALLDKKAHLLKLWEKLHVDDEYFTDTFSSIESLEEASDLVEWVSMKYYRQIKELSQAAGADLLPEDEDLQLARSASLKYKRASGTSRYEMAKRSMISKFAEVCLRKHAVSRLCQLLTHTSCSKSLYLPRH